MSVPHKGEVMRVYAKMKEFFSAATSGCGLCGGVMIGMIGGAKKPKGQVALMLSLLSSQVGNDALASSHARGKGQRRDIAKEASVVRLN